MCTKGSPKQQYVYLGTTMKAQTEKLYNLKLSSSQCTVRRRFLYSTCVGMNALLDDRLWDSFDPLGVRSDILKLRDTKLEQHITDGQAGRS